MIQSKSNEIRLLASTSAKIRQIAHVSASQLERSVRAFLTNRCDHLENRSQSSHSTKSVLIVDDVGEWRAHVCKFFENQPGWLVAGEACDGLQAIQMAAELSPDLVLLDIGMPALNGLEAAGQIQQISPQSKIVFLTQERDADVRSAALATGAHGYVLKANAGSELLPTLTGVLRNGHRR